MLKLINVGFVLFFFFSYIVILNLKKKIPPTKLQPLGYIHIILHGVQFGIFVKSNLFMYSLTLQKQIATPNVNGTHP